MSEFLRTQQCVHQVHDRQCTHCEHNHRFQTHLSLPTSCSSVHALAEVHVRNRQAEKPDRNRDPKYVLHILPRTFCSLARTSPESPCSSGSRYFADLESSPAPLSQAHQYSRRE